MIYFQVCAGICWYFPDHSLWILDLRSIHNCHFDARNRTGIIFPTTLLYYLINMFLLSFNTIFYIVARQSLASQNLPIILRDLACLSAAIILLYWLCKTTKEITKRFKEIADLLYGYLWDQLPFVNKEYMLCIISAAQKPIYLHGIGKFKCSSGSFRLVWFLVLDFNLGSIVIPVFCLSFAGGWFGACVLRFLPFHKPINEKHLEGLGRSRIVSSQIEILIT